MNLEKHNLERSKSAEKIKEAAILYQGKIFSGISHGHAIANLQEEHPDVDYSDIEKPNMDGFVTTAGRFVDRKEAVEIAKKSRQIRRDKNSEEETWLFSEDIEE